MTHKERFLANRSDDWFIRPKEPMELMLYIKRRVVQDFHPFLSQSDIQSVR